MYVSSLSKLPNCCHTSFYSLHEEVFNTKNKHKIKIIVLNWAISPVGYGETGNLLGEEMRGPPPPLKVCE